MQNTLDCLIFSPHTINVLLISFFLVFFCTFQRSFIDKKSHRQRIARHSHVTLVSLKTKSNLDRLSQRRQTWICFAPLEPFDMFQNGHQLTREMNLRASPELDFNEDTFEREKSLK